MADKIVDRRDKGWFSIPNNFLNGYAKEVGWQGQLVYMALSRHADNQGKSFPSLGHLAEELGISRNSVLNGLKVLKEYNIVQTEKRYSKQGQASNLYILLGKTKWEKVYDYSNRKK